MCGNPTLSCPKYLFTISFALWWLSVAWLAETDQGLAAVAGSPQAPIATEDFSTLQYVLPRDWASATTLTPRLGSATLAVQSGARVAGKALKWTVAGAADAIAVTRPSWEPPGAVVLWVKNPRGAALTIQLLGVAIPGGVLQWPAQDISHCRNWTRLRWPAEAAVPVGTQPTAGPSAQPCPCFLPIYEWRLIAAKQKDAKAAEIYLDEFSVEPAPERQLTVHSIRPQATEVPGGGTLSVEVELETTSRPAATGQPRLCLARSDGRLCAWRYLAAEALGGGRHALPLTLVVPASLPAGEYKLVVRAAGTRIEGAAAEGMKVAVTPPAAKVSPTTIFPKAIANLVGHSVADWRLSPTRAYLVPACANFDARGLAPDVALPDGQRCWDGLEEMLNALVQHDPEATALVEVFAGAAPTWLATHPDDCAKLLPLRARPAAPRQRNFPSFSSAAWQEAAAADLAALVNHIAASPWAGMVSGYVLASGDDTWATFLLDPVSLPDYSPAALSAFRAWVREKYKTLPDLRTAWGQARHPVMELMKALPPDEPRPIMAWDEVTLPVPERRLTAPTDLLEPPMFQDVADVTLFLAEQSATAAAKLARATKLLTKVPVGILYGGWLADSEDPIQLAAAGHLALGHLLRSPDVDFLVFKAEDATAAWLAPFASAKFHGKPWLLKFTSPGNAQEQSSAESLAEALGAGAAGIIAPVGSPQLTAAWRAAGETQPETPKRPQVAAIVDAASAAHICPASSLATDVLAQQLRQLEASGLRCEIWELADVLEGRTPDAPLLLFVNAYLLGQRERELLATLRAAGRVLVFSYAAGAMAPYSGISGRRVFSLTGVAVTSLPGTGPLRVVPTPNIDPFTSHVAAGTEYGTTRKVTPWFCCVDSRAEVLGKVAGTNLIGLAAVRGPDWTSVYSAAPALPASLLRSLAQMAEALAAQ